ATRHQPVPHPPIALPHLRGERLGSAPAVSPDAAGSGAELGVLAEADRHLAGALGASSTHANSLPDVTAIALCPARSFVMTKWTEVSAFPVRHRRWSARKTGKTAHAGWEV